MTARDTEQDQRQTQSQSSMDGVVQVASLEAYDMLFLYVLLL